MTAATAAQIGAIHSIAKAMGLDDSSRREVIASASGGKRSSRDLTDQEARRVIDQLKLLQGGGSAQPKASGDLAGRYAPKLRALWLSGWHLGVVRDRTDTALLSFVKRQTGLDHTRFLRDPADARRAIEALKAWLAREAGVEWPASGDVDASKLAVYRAQLRQLARFGLPTGDLVPAPGTNVDAEIRSSGAVLRRALKAAERKVQNARAAG